MWRNRFLAICGLLSLISWIALSNSNNNLFAPSSAVPVVSCAGQMILQLNNSGERSLVAVQLDDGSYDPSGGFLWFKARRVMPGHCGSDSLFRSQLHFCCEDAGDTIDVVLRVYNIPVDTGGISPQYGTGNYADCITRVVITENVKPLISTLAADTVLCEEYVAGIVQYPVAGDNCCLDTILYFDQFITYDTACKRGNVRRRFTAVDCAGNTATSTQIITVVNEQFYLVQFPPDAVLSGCTNLSVAALGAPVIFDESCENMNITFIDTMVYGQPQGLPCILLKRSWKVFNWCNYNGQLPLVHIPNPNPNPDLLSNGNWPGPMVGPVGAASVVAISPGDTATDFSNYWTQNVNGYTYTQYIRIYDPELPQGRIASPGGFCDLTTNDMNLWQGGNWYYPPTGSDNLPECPVNVAFKALDNCSLNDLNIRYKLLLDLNNDGVPETMVDSDNPPPSGSISYNNLNPGSEEQRQFDKRIIGINQKYNFALEKNYSGDSILAKVKWNTTAAPNTFTTPQIPYGHHGITWYVSDKCGNQTSFYQVFSVSDDCEPPVITCVSGLDMNIPPNGDSIYLSVTDLVFNVTDNVTPSAQIEKSIEEEPWSSSFPEDEDGNPIPGIWFDCSDLGFRTVRIWARDGFGNTSFCESVITIADPDDACPAGPPAISGTLTTLNNLGMGMNFDLFQMPDTVYVATSTTAGNQGYYYFNNLTQFGSYFVKPQRDTSDWLNGVNAYDLILISRHILNLEPLNSPYKLIAADVNRSGTITTFDIVTARKVLLGSLPSFTGNDSWRFVPAHFQFPNPQNPFENNIPGQINFPSVYEVVNDANFFSIKVGDVDQTSIPNQLSSVEIRNLPEGLLLSLGKPVGQRIPLYAKPVVPVAGFQFALEVPGITGFTPELLSTDHFSLHDNLLSVVWDNPVSPDQAPPILGWISLNDPEFNSGLFIQDRPNLRSAAFTNDGQSLAVHFLPADQQFNTGQFAVMPNPFDGDIRLRGNIDTDGLLDITITNLQGQELYHQYLFAAKGLSTCAIPAANWPPGIYICRVGSKNGVQVIRTVKSGIQE